jgi:hypothetical protein
MRSGVWLPTFWRKSLSNLKKQAIISSTLYRLIRLHNILALKIAIWFLLLWKQQILDSNIRLSSCKLKHAIICIQGIHKRMVQFQKLTRNQFLIHFLNCTILLWIPWKLILFHSDVNSSDYRAQNYITEMSCFRGTTWRWRSPPVPWHCCRQQTAHRGRAPSHRWPSVTHCYELCKTWVSTENIIFTFSSYSVSWVWTTQNHLKLFR